MSVTSLPEWKQQLLERKRRDEEVREQREKTEEQKLASMPAWKRGIIQRRKAKYDGPGEACPIETRSPSDGLSDTDSSITVNLGSEVSTSPDPGFWFDIDPKTGNQVSLETIVPVNENPFIRIHKRKAREAELSSPKNYDGEIGRGREFEIKMEKFRDLSEGREKEQSKQTELSRSRSVPKEKDRNPKRHDKELLKVKKDDYMKEEYRDSDSASPVFSPTVPHLRTIRADNIIIIEQERKSSDERRCRWDESERSEEENLTKRGLKMDLKEILAGGGSVTEIRASEVLIIKPSEVKNKEEMEKTDGKREGREGRELRADISWLKDKAKECVKEKERPRGQATVIKDERKDSYEDSVFLERGGRVSLLLSRFGEHRKPPSRSKSSENLIPPPQSYEDDTEDGNREHRRHEQLKGVPKRSFSFCDRVFTAKENGCEEELRMRDRIHSEKAHWTEVASLGRDNAAKIKMGCARLLEKDRLGRHRHWQAKEKQNRGIIDGEESFTVASVKNVEGISFAKRVPIRQEGRARDRNYGVEKGAKIEGQNFECKIQAAIPRDASQRHESTSRESSSLFCALQDNSHRHMQASSGIGSSLTQHNAERIVDSNDKGEKMHKITFEVSKSSFPSNNGSGSVDTKTTISGAQSAPPDIQIPRTVFFVAEEIMDKKKPSSAQDWGREGERGDSLKAGKPVSRVESLKEKYRQLQIENTKQKDVKDDNNCEETVACETVVAITMTGAEMEPEEQSHIGQSVVEVEKEAALLTSVHANDIAQEVSVAKGSPQLPDSLSAFGEGEEVDAGGGNNTERSPSPESDEEGENVQNEVSWDDFLEDDKQFYEEDLRELTEDLESEESLSPSLPDSNSLEEMSRIYNLETVGSRSGLCIRDRAGDSVHLIKVKPLNTQQQEEGIQSIQRQIEGFKLKEQEVQKSQISVLQNVRQSPKGNTSKQQTTATKQDKIFSPQTSPRRVNSPDQSIEINSSILRSQSPENSLKILDLAPTPVSSPCSPSPSPSPNSSPAQSPTPTALFTIKSASGGQVKRGATITITPKKPQAPRPSPTASPTLKTTTTVTEPTKKKYPTVEEIVVIGGYLNLDKSCLVKNRGTAKKVKVCFSEERLEQLCEYPAESSVWPASPFPLDLDWDPDLDLRMDSIPKTTRSVGTAMTRGLRAGQCHPLLKKHSV